MPPREKKRQPQHQTIAEETKRIQSNNANSLASIDAQISQLEAEERRLLEERKMLQARLNTQTEKE